VPPAAEGAWHPLLLRVVSALVMIAVVAGAVVLGPPYFDLFIGVSAVVLAWEWVRLCGARDLLLPLCLLAAAVVAAVALAATTRALYGLAACAGGSALLWGLGSVARWEHRDWLALGALYVGLPALAFVWIAHDPHGGRLTIAWMIATVAATDTGAYFAGRLVGGPKLAPAVSPNKTWAGLAGGIACAAAVGAAWSAAAGIAGPGLLAVKGLILGAISQAGDLFESGIKRRFGVKDTGGIIPGHGGLFDRVDGHIAAAVTVAAFNWATGSGVLTWR
jgi:phosphatidate cytidylyltransferase